MTPFRLIPLLALIPCFAARGGSDESTVSDGAGANSGTSTPDQPVLNVSGSNGSGNGNGNGGSNGNGECGPNLTGLVRDFRAKDEMGGHPDFEAFSGSDASVGIVQDMLRPMLKSWLDENLPVVVERLVRAEIERVSRGR